MPNLLRQDPEVGPQVRQGGTADRVRDRGRDTGEEDDKDDHQHDFDDEHDGVVNRTHGGEDDYDCGDD